MKQGDTQGAVVGYNIVIYWGVFFDEPWNYGPLNLLRPNLFIQAYIMYILDNLLNDNRFKYIVGLLRLLSEFKFP